MDKLHIARDDRGHGRPGISILINHHQYFAPKPQMSGAELKALDGIPANNRLFREEHGNQPDTPIPDDLTVDLHAGDHFYDLPVGIVGGSLPPTVLAQLERVHADYPGVQLTSRPDGSLWLVLPASSIRECKVPGRAVRFTVPAGYPEVPPQGIEVSTDGGQTWSGMCYRAASWNPARDTLWKYVKFCLQRLTEV